MKHFLIIALFMPALFAAPSTAGATEGFSTGHNLKEWCDKMDSEDLSWGLCVGSITAGFDMIMTYQNSPNIVKSVCLPKGATRADVLRELVAYMKEHPGDLKYSLGDLLFAGYVDKFPCK